MEDVLQTLFSNNIFISVFTLAVTLSSVLVGSLEVLKRYTKMYKDELAQQKVNYNIIIENNEENTSEENSKDLATSYKLKQDTLLELSEKRNTDKSFKKLSFMLLIIMSVIGTIILFVGIVLSFIFETKIGWITTASGGIVEIVASIYFWLVNKTIKEVKENSQQLENTKNQITAMELVEKISDPNVKDTVYVEMIKSLIEKK